MGMTRDEFAVLVKGMKSVYVDEKFIPDKTSFDVWYALLQDLDYNTCSMAVQRWMMTSKWKPTVADIRQTASKNLNSPADSGEAWEMARNAVRKFGYGRRQEALAWLPSEISQAVERFGWGDLCDMKSDEVMASRAQFMRIYQQVADRASEMSMLSTDMRQLIESKGEEEYGNNRIEMGRP